MIQDYLQSSATPAPPWGSRAITGYSRKRAANAQRLRAGCCVWSPWAVLLHLAAPYCVMPGHRRYVPGWRPGPAPLKRLCNRQPRPRSGRVVPSWYLPGYLPGDPATVSFQTATPGSGVVLFACVCSVRSLVWIITGLTDQEHVWLLQHLKEFFYTQTSIPDQTSYLIPGPA
jgi:hypothetical protein